MRVNVRHRVEVKVRDLRDVYTSDPPIVIELETNGPHRVAHVVIPPLHLCGDDIRAASKVLHHVGNIADEWEQQGKLPEVTP